MEGFINPPDEQAGHHFRLESAHRLKANASLKQGHCFDQDVVVGDKRLFIANEPPPDCGRRRMILIIGGQYGQESRGVDKDGHEA
jgi:hypothetical protein